MNAQTKSLVCGVLILLAVPVAAPAAEISHRCSQQVNDAQRLACYDAEFGKPRAAMTGSAASAAAPALSTAPAEVTRPAVAPAAPVMKSEKTDKPASFMSSIASLRRMSDGRQQATLENGEVWAQVESDPRAEMRVGDSVTIRRAALGSFMLVTPSGAPTRVKRVQ